MARLLFPRMPGRPAISDVALAAALCFLAAGGLVSGQVHERPLGVTLPIAVVSTLGMALRRMFPVTVASTVSILAVAQALLTGSASNTLWALVVFLVSAYTVAAERDEGWALAGLGAVLGSQFVCEWLDHGTDYPFDTLVFGGVWLFGRGTRTWRKQATYAEQHRDDLARIAVTQERTRIARELHDVVAHSLSVIAVQSDAAEAALASEPDRAAAPMRAIRECAHEALVDMRQMLHVLRADQDGCEDEDLAPARGVADLPPLVAAMRDSGMTIDADIRPGVQLSSGTQLTVFRIVQEGLTNIRKHAGAVPTRLLVIGDGTLLRIEIRNDAPATTTAPVDPFSTGHGLVGIRERVRAVGGSLRAGPTPSGGFELIVGLPIASTETARR